MEQRYARQLALPEIGRKGQRALQKGRVLVVGVGGLGSPAALYLAAAGVGTLGLADGDVVELSNLQRQILHTTASVGQLKVDSAARGLAQLNPGVRIEKHARRLRSEDGVRLVRRYDFIIDATDTHASKRLVAAVCHRAGRPYVHAGIEGFRGQVFTVLPGKTACYACVFGPASPRDPRIPRGPLGAVPGILGCVQAAEAVRYLLGCGRLLTDRILICDVMNMDVRVVPVRRNDACRVCGKPAVRRDKANRERNAR